MKNGAFKFEAERAYPQGGGSIDLTTNYGFLKISENKSECDLPFFGRAYRMEYGGDGGMNFEGEIFNEKWTLNDKKMKVTYTFDVKDKETFTVIMEVFLKNRHQQLFAVILKLISHIQVKLQSWKKKIWMKNNIIASSPVFEKSKCHFFIRKIFLV